MSAALVSPFSDFNDVIFQQRKARSQSVSMLGLSMERQYMESRSRHGSSNSSNNMMLNSCGSMSPPTPSSVAMISLGDGAALFNRSAALGHGHPLNSYNNTANNTNVPTARKLDRSVSEPCDRNAKNAGGNVNSARYKTELCRPFEENGYCKYGDKCQFAHGNNEQRSLARHPKYKTELCRTFHTIGFCPYGPRCHFIHNEDERRLSQIIQMKQQQVAAQHALHQAAAAQNTLQQLQHQMQSQSTSPVNLPSHSVSSPTPVQRPRSLNLSLSMVRDSLGSTADSPPSSFTDSPSISPNYLAEDLLAAASIALCNTPPASAPAAFTSAFTFPEMSQQQSTPTPIMTPLNVQTTDPLASLAAGLQAASLRSHMTNNNTYRELSDSLYTPPSPPDSLNGDSIMQPPPCETAMDLSRGLRLPIFSRLSNED